MQAGHVLLMHELSRVVEDVVDEGVGVTPDFPEHADTKPFCNTLKKSELHLRLQRLPHIPGLTSLCYPLSHLTLNPTSNIEHQPRSQIHVHKSLLLVGSTPEQNQEA